MHTQVNTPIRKIGSYADQPTRKNVDEADAHLVFRFRISAAEDTDNDAMKALQRGG
jgi:hypothetical protein